MIRGISHDVIGGFGVSSFYEPRFAVVPNLWVRYYRSPIPNATRTSTDSLFQAVALAITVSDPHRESDL
jgi:hypothetical protein